tara:strand:- start:4740 stop:5135 length:396 start_codon:yes stop_codon:yes gene_type:complete
METMSNTPGPLGQPLNYYEKPLTVSNGDNVSCNYIKIPNAYVNTPGVQTPVTLDGKTVAEMCVPNLSWRGSPNFMQGFSNNKCVNNKPKHLTFKLKDDYSDELVLNKMQDCYIDPTCQHKSNICYDPYMGA